MNARFTVLGPVEVLSAGRSLPGLAPRHRAVLAYLLLHAGTVISTERLIGAVWGDEPPDTARAQVHAAVTTIRRALRTADAADLLASRAGGYVVPPGPGQLDLAEFTGQVAVAQEQAEAGDAQGAAGQLRAALALWRGEPLADVTAGYIPEARARLEGRRLAAVEQLAELELSLGRHGELVDELAAEVAGQPLRERLCRQLMLALHRTGRQADALAAARSFRTALAEQQGLDPSRAFVALEQSILRDEPALEGLPGQRRRVNFLPYDTPDFAGRADELGRLARSASDAGPTIWLIDGMAGVGKTTLAVRAAYQLAARFPDGQLFVDLQAHTPGREPVEPGTALEILLRQLGVPSERIPDSVPDRAALWRAELSDRKVLAVLDNAADTGRLRPLLPGSSRSLLLITSRRRLTGLDGAKVLSVDLLPAEDSVSLFTRIVGDRADAEALAVLDVLHLCGFLPLALRIAAARLQHRPRWTVTYLASRLRDQRRRLNELSAEDRGVAAAFTLSYQHLDQAHQHMFRLLGLHPGRDIDTRAAAALAGVTPDQAEALLEDLLDAHMLLQHEPGRYTFHDLLREHARGTAAAQETAAARQDGLTRLLDHYLRSAAAATGVLFPVSMQRRPGPAEPGPSAVPFAGAGDALAWLDAERANLVAAGAHAAERGWPAHATGLAEALSGYLYDYGHHAEAVAVHTQALHAGRRLGDRAAQASTLIDLAWLSFRQGRYGQAEEHAGRALDISRDAGEPHSEARALNALGNIRSRQHDYAQAYQHFRGALRLYRQLGERVGEAHALGNLGIVYERQGQWEQAHDHLRQALDQYRELGDQGLEEAIARTHLGVVCRREGRYVEARGHHQRALEVFRELGNRSEEADSRNGLGEAAQAMGDPGQAVTDHDAALALAREAGNRLEQARAHHGLARAHRDLGHGGLAREHAGEAVGIYLSLGLPEAAEARDLVASLS